MECVYSSTNELVHLSQIGRPVWTPRLLNLKDSEFVPPEANEDARPTSAPLPTSII